MLYLHILKNQPRRLVGSLERGALIFVLSADLAWHMHGFGRNQKGAFNQNAKTITYRKCWGKILGAEKF